MELAELGIMAGVLLFMGFLTIRVAVGIIRQKSKAISAQQLLAALGFKNFQVLDLDKLTQPGFVRLIQLVRELKPTSSGGMQGQMAEIMALAQLGGSLGPGNAAQKPSEQPPVLTY